MAEHKTNSRILDRSEQISRMVKQTAVKAKENTTEAHAEQQSAVGYADEKLHVAGKALTVKSIRIGQIGYDSTRKSMSKADAAIRKAQVQKKFKHQQAVNKNSTANEKTGTISTNQTGNTVGVYAAAFGSAGTAKYFNKASTCKSCKPNTAVHSVSEAFTRITKSIASGIKTTVGSSTAMMTALLAGAAVCVVIIILLALIGGMFNTGQNTGYTEVSEQVQQYRPVIQQYAMRHNTACQII